MTAADPYGFGAVALASLKLFEMSSRSSGRTSRLVEIVQNGDQIVCADAKEASRLQSLLREAGKSAVRVLHVPETVHPLSRVGTAPRGRTFFDHDWVRRHFERLLIGAADDLEAFARQMSKTWPAAADRDSEMAEKTRYVSEFVRRG